MVLGKKEIGAILLAIVAIVFYLVLLSARSSGAQIIRNQTVVSGVTPNQITQPTVSNQIAPQPTTLNPNNQGNQGGAIAIANAPPRKKQRPTTVINVPNRPLPPSGGLSVYGMVAGFLLAGAGLLALGLVIRRGPRR